MSTFSMPETESLTGKKRSRASQACVYCRSKRSKCDGQPNRRSCTQCKEKNIACEFVQGRRNRRHLEDQTVALQEEVQHLHRALADARNKDRSNSIAWDTGSTLPPELESLDAGGTAATFPNLGLAQSYDDHEVLWNTELPFERPQTYQAAGLAGEDASSFFSGGPFQQSQPGRALTSTASDGQAVASPRQRQRLQKEHSQRDPTLRATEHFLTACLSKSAIDYLVGLFFTRCMVMMKFVPPSQFLPDEDSGSPNRRPSSLLLAIIAAALRYATREDVLDVCFDKEGNNVPAALAKKLLETELLDADISTIQALLAISEVETSNNNMMSGIMYGSMAVRLLFNLRLDYGSGAESALSKEDAVARYWLLWNLSVQDHCWSTQLKCPPSIHPSRLKAARKLFESTDASPRATLPATESFESSINSYILSLMIVAREITLELYGVAPKSRPALVPKLDLKFRTWLKDVPDDIDKDPIGHHFSYHFHFAFHMMIHATWLTIHRELAYVDNADAHLGPQAQNSWAVIKQSATKIAKLFETFRRTDDARLFHGSGVQWISLAVEGLSNVLEKIPIDQAIEPLAHLQSLRRTLKVLSSSFSQAALLYSSTSLKTQEFVRRMEGDEILGSLPAPQFKVPPIPVSRLGQPGKPSGTRRGSVAEGLRQHQEPRATSSQGSQGESADYYPNRWLPDYGEDMVMGDDGVRASSLTIPNVAQFDHLANGLHMN